MMNNNHFVEALLHDSYDSTMMKITSISTFETKNTPTLNACPISYKQNEMAYTL